MIRSMTGFGAAVSQVDGAHYVIEIRSLNNKYFKSTIRLPEDLQGLEAELDAALMKRFTRGSIVLTARFSDTSAAAAAQINTAAIQRYLEQLLAVPGLGHDSAHIDMGALLSLPGVVITSTGEELLDRVRPIFLRLVQEAADKLEGMRTKEGQLLHADLHRHRQVIADRLAVIAERTPKVVHLYQERLRSRINTLLAEVGATVKDEELLREVAIYAERCDIAEEVARLGGHLDQFRDIIDSKDREPAGRTLDFLTQEMLREANTIASKSLDAEISRRIVEVKGAIDRIKEQAQNVE